MATDWSQFWQPIVAALPTIIVALLSFIAVVFGSAGVAIRAMVKSTAGKEAAYLGKEATYLEMVKSNMDELKELRKDQRESDRREIALHDEIRQVRDDGDRKLGEAVAKSDKKMADMKRDYEARITDLEKTIDDLQTQLAAKEAELQKEREARQAAETARDLAELKRAEDRRKTDEKIRQFENLIADLQKQVTKAADSEVKPSGE